MQADARTDPSRIAKMLGLMALLLLVTQAVPVSPLADISHGTRRSGSELVRPVAAQEVLRITLASRSLRLRGGGAVTAVPDGSGDERRSVGVIDLLPHCAVVRQTMVGVCEVIDGALADAQKVCAGKIAPPPLSTAAISAMRALQPLLDTFG